MDTPVTPEGAALVYENQTCTWSGTSSENVIHTGRTLEQCAQDASDGDFKQFRYKVSFANKYQYFKSEKNVCTLHKEKCMPGTTRDEKNTYVYEPVHVQTNEEIIKELEERVRIQQLLNALGEAGTDG